MEEGWPPQVQDRSAVSNPTSMAVFLLLQPVWVPTHTAAMHSRTPPSLPPTHPPPCCSPEGTLKAAAAKLKHVADLGFTMLELMPCSEFSDPAKWGYSPRQLMALQEDYGTPEVGAPGGGGCVGWRVGGG
jgi:hypothetical protein